MKSAPRGDVEKKTYKDTQTVSHHVECFVDRLSGKIFHFFALRCSCVVSGRVFKGVGK